MEISTYGKIVTPCSSDLCEFLKTMGYSPVSLDHLGGGTWEATVNGKTRRYVVWASMQCNKSGEPLPTRWEAYISK